MTLKGTFAIVAALFAALTISACDLGGGGGNTGCELDGDCESGYCDLDSGQCVTCLKDLHCASGKYCHPEQNICVACFSDVHCEEGVCDQSASYCVECTSDQHCESGQCDEDALICIECGTDAECADDNDCTLEACTNGQCTVVPLPDTYPCEDGDACTLGDGCMDGECTAGQTDPDCIPDPTCEDLEDGAPCDDGDECTFDDFCKGGVCVGDSVNPDCFEEDLDGDGFTVEAGDCDDQDPEVHPDAPEFCDGKDNDCDGEVDEGACGECVKEGMLLKDPSLLCCDGLVPALDCVNEALGELFCMCTEDFICVACGDGQCGKGENECNCPEDCPWEPEDLDGDGYPADIDCDDLNPEVNPGAKEICNGIDDNCDGVVDEGCDCVDDILCDDGNDCTKDACMNGMCVHEIIPDCSLNCGGIAGFPCPDGMFCLYEFGTCGEWDLFGQCVPYPEGCYDLWAPVCGCDGMTYGNDCEAHAHGVSIKHEGSCEGPCLEEEICFNGIDDDCDGLIDEGCDICEEGACNDWDPCTEDICDPVIGACINKPIPGCCTDDAGCGWGEHCEIEVCPGCWCEDPTDPDNCPPCLCWGKCVPDEPQCETDDDCPPGHICESVTICPDCVNEDPPCLAPCWTENQCVPAPNDCEEAGGICLGLPDEPGNGDLEMCPAGFAEVDLGGCQPWEICCMKVEPVECLEHCDCYDLYGNDFPEPCAMMCPTCDNFWLCEEGQCIPECGPIPEEVWECILPPNECEEAGGKCLGPDATDPNGNIGCPDGWGEADLPGCSNNEICCLPEPEPECAEMCDCYDLYGEEFETPCPLDCYNCGNYWECVEGKCVEECGMMPAEVEECLKPQQCFLNGDCPDGQYCQYPEGSCPTNSPWEPGGIMGTCIEIPELCIEIWAPVCGCNGKTYANDCFMAADSQSLDYPGACEEPCVPEGEKYQPEPDPNGVDDNQCCEGLEPIVDCFVVDIVCEDDGTKCETICACVAEMTYVCTQCGNGECGLGENVCSCPEDCPEPWACTASGDCDDGNPCTDDTCVNGVCVSAIGPEICYDGKDNDCDGIVDENDCEGIPCGGFIGLPCPDDMYCQYPEGQCNWADNLGMCVPVPEMCPALWAPVCGCDGVTYANECTMAVSQVSMDHDGECGQECKELKPYDYGPCDMVLGWGFTGNTCVHISGCSCEPDCGAFFATEEECLKTCLLDIGGW